jgi:hypothetical protein
LPALMSMAGKEVPEMTDHEKGGSV